MLEASCRKILRHVENPRVVKRDACMKNSLTFLPKFLPASLLDVSVAIRADNSGRWIGNGYNSDKEHNRSQNGRIYMERFVRYNPVMVIMVITRMTMLLVVYRRVCQLRVFYNPEKYKEYMLAWVRKFLPSEFQLSCYFPKLPTWRHNFVDPPPPKKSCSSYSACPNGS
jgi:hypothetical protein